MQSLRYPYLDSINSSTVYPELHTDANAASDPNGNEADATTGFTSVGLTGTGTNVFESQSSIVNTGTYALRAEVVDTPFQLARFYMTLNSPTFIAGTVYKTTFDARHSGTGDNWRIGISASNVASPLTGFGHTLTNTNTTFQSYEITWIHSDTQTDHFVGREIGGGDNGGVYLDNLSFEEVNPVEGEYEFNGNANDTSFNAYNGTVNGALLTKGAYGGVDKAYTFDGIDDNITTSMNKTLSSISFRINPSANTRDIIQLSVTAKISISAGNKITTTGLTNPVIKVNYSIGDDIALNEFSDIYIEFDSELVDNVIFGFSATYFEGDMDRILFYNRILAIEEQKSIFKKL